MSIQLAALRRLSRSFMPPTAIDHRSVETLCSVFSVGDQLPPSRPREQNAGSTNHLAEIMLHGVPLP